MDTDDLDDADLAQLEAEQVSPRSRRDRLREQSMPLLVGLLDSASARRSDDGTLQLLSPGAATQDDSEQVDLEGLAAKRLAGGGMLDSVANMANSILGAGETVYVSILVPSQYSFC